jgi:phosphoribosylamine--glycine ligase
MNILLVGSGGREHALAWKILQSPLVTRLVCAPGNPGMAALCETRAVAPIDVDGLLALAREMAADLVVIGPEVAVEAGLADALAVADIPCFGPSAAAGRLESSKAFTKAFADRCGLPTGAYRVCETPEAARAALALFSPPYVIKADGLAAGKGVTVAADRGEADAAIDDVFGGKFGAAGARVVIEEFLDGPEVSVFAVTDGETVLPMVPAQDFKRVGDGDTGPNTGGMGAYSPLPWAPPDLVDEVLATVLTPTVEEMSRRGTPFRGLLYAGLALTSRGVRVVEFNARFGDPETQVVLPRLRTPLGRLLHAAATGGLAELGPLEWSADAAVTVVLAAPGYPESPSLGGVVTGLAEAAATPGAVVLHAGTGLGPDGEVISTGGRVLSVVGTGADLPAARGSAYAALAHLRLDGGHFRTDIAAAV